MHQHPVTALVIPRKGVNMLGNYPEFARPAVKAANDKFKVVLEQSEKLLKQEQLQNRVALLEDLKLTNRLVTPTCRSPFYGVLA